MLFYFSVIALPTLLLLLAYHYRTKLALLIPARVVALIPLSIQNRINDAGYTPLSFADQAGAGFSSSAFDLEANIQDGDSRSGLDPQGVEEIREIMRRERVGFDQARLIRHNNHLARNGIDPTGMPIDSKAVTRL